MRTLRILQLPVIAALCAAIFLLPSVAVTQQTKQGEKAIKARQGFMDIVVWEAGPLFAMAKGDMAYDAGTANGNAKNLNALLQYDVGRLFIDGTTKANYTGKTRALAAIWEDPEKFSQAYQALRDRVAQLVEEAGKGQPELTAAVSEMGKACGNCHDNFRADDF